eukprot:s5678_g5.t1
MDLQIHCAAFSLGVKKSSVRLPWEQEQGNTIFSKRPRLIAPPVFVPHVSVPDDSISLQKAEVEGKIHWSKRTSLIPWPVAQDRALAKALESWRLLLMDNLEGSLVGRQISMAMRGVEGTPAVEQTIADALAGKSVSTLRARASSLLAFGRWKKSLDVQSFIFPISEEQAYAYVRELRELNAPRTKPSRFVEAVSFAYHMLGAEVDNAMNSPRVKGAVAIPLVLPSKKCPLTVAQVTCLERLAFEDEGALGIFAGYTCMILHMRLRWMDGQFSQAEPFLDLFEGVGFLETELYHHKNAGRQRHAKRLLPAACNIPGLAGFDWASPWLQHRKQQGLSARPGYPTMPAPLSGGGWALVPLEASQATAWLREVLQNVDPALRMDCIGTHSLKATLLSMMSKAGCATDLRRLAGYHIDPSSKMALEYSRDAQAPVLHALQAINMAIQNGLFDPDASRARRWPNRNCTTLDSVMTFLSKMTSESGWYNVHNHWGAEQADEDAALNLEWERVEETSEGYEPTEPADDLWGDVDSISSLSDPGERPLFQADDCETSDEERDADVAAPIVGRGLAEDLEQVISDVVFKHVVSGCCHIAKHSDVDPSDGEAVCVQFQIVACDVTPSASVQGWTTHATYAFSVATQPGADEQAFVDGVVVPILGQPDHIDAPKLRRLFFESHTLTAADLRRKVDSTQLEAPRKLPAPEISQRLEMLQQRISPLIIANVLEPSHQLINALVQCVEDGRVRYIEWSRCTARTQEVNNVKEDGDLRMWKTDSSGNIKAVHKEPSISATLTTELDVHNALRRRGIA